MTKLLTRPVSSPAPRWIAVGITLGLLSLGGCGDDFPRQDPTTAAANTDTSALDTSVADGVDSDAGGDGNAADSGVGDTAAGDTAVGDTTTRATDAALPFACTADTDCAVSSGPCEQDRCQPNGTCAIALRPTGSLCDDGDACTAETVCVNGACGGGKTTCPCDVASDCAPLEDNDLCNGTLYCDHTTSPAACKVNPATVVTCPPGDVCAPTSCDPASGGCKALPQPDGKSCDNGAACTTGDACKAGVCAAGKNVCGCATTADCASKEDGDLCNGTLYCDNTVFPPVCKVNPATTVACAASLDPCAATVCKPTTGGCVSVPLADGTTCTDGDVCSGAGGVDACKAGVCQPGTPSCACQKDADCAAADDGDLCNGSLFCDTSKAPFHCAINPKTVVTCDTSLDTTCTQTACAPKTGKCGPTPTADGVACSDGDVCSVGDACKSGLCAPGPNACACTADADCAQFEDGDLCNGQLFCDKAALPFTCKVKAASVVFCNPSQDSGCVKATCVPKTGACLATVLADGTQCDADGNPCTVADTCAKGACEADANACDCVVDADCAQHDDGDVCNGALYCNTVKKPFKCDVNPLTVISCAKTGDSQCSQNRCDAKTGKCGQVALPNGVLCNADNNVCSGPDQCQAGECKVGAAVCACTTDADCLSTIDPCAGKAFCDKSQTPFACAVQPNTAVSCTLPSAQSGACAAALCSSNQGVPACGVVQAPPGSPCDDGKAWTIADVCDGGGACSGVAGLVCSTHVDCAPLDNDANLCNGGARCVIATGAKAGACEPNPLPIICVSGDDVCAPVTCQPATGLCLPQSSTATVGKACDDNNPCTAAMACTGDGCTWVKSLTDCDDANLCTLDSCGLSAGCTHTSNVGAACADNDPCTQGDTCVGSTCAAGSVTKSCGDSDPCTLDACDPTTGACTHKPIAGCSGCKSASECDDNLPCTAASCASGVCTNTKENAGSCDDGDPCTLIGVCALGVCKTPPKVCKDSKLCTDDSCDKKTGACVFAVSSAACDDGNPCTEASCDSAGGCQQTPAHDGDACDKSAVCAAGSCGACGYWSKSVAPSTAVAGGALVAAYYLTADTLVFAGRGTSANGGHAWTHITDKNGAPTANYVSNTATGDGATSVIEGENSTELRVVSAPVSQGGKSARIMEYKLPNKALAILKSHSVETGGGFTDIDRSTADKRWLVAGTTGGSEARGWLLLVDKKGETKEEAKLDKHTGLEGCVVASTDLMVGGGYAESSSKTTALMVGHDAKLKQWWQQPLETSGESAVFDVVLGNAKQTIGLGARGPSLATSHATAWAVMAATGKSVWSWSDANSARTVLTGGASMADGGVLAVGSIERSATAHDGLLVRLGTSGKLMWRKEVKLLSNNDLHSVSVSGTTAIASGATRETEGLGWIMRFGVDGTLYCSK